MKLKKVVGAFLVLCFAMLSTGCDGAEKELDKQVEKLNKTYESGALFDEDYKMSFSLSVKDTSGISYTDMMMKKDGQNLYMYISDNTSVSDAWVGEKDGKYYIFYDGKVSKKYEEISSSELSYIHYKMKGYPNGIRDAYLTAVSKIDEYKSKCEEEEVTCEVKKKFLGNEISFKMEDSGSKNLQAFEIDIKGGKITRLYKKEISFGKTIDYTVTFDYSDQTVTLPLYEGYSYMRGVSSYL